ncbi:MAG: hypothetical protein K8F27_09995, partial [Sulfuricellaceae bacterium]|nr:hypothetical protein [Sulfuricellaceae bacterium]
SKDSGPSPERGSTKPAKTAKSPSSRPAPAKQTTAKSHTPNEAKFQVKLASAEVSTKNIDKNAPQQQVKELITSTDDQTASVLALTNQVNHLENQLVQLQTQLSKLNIQLVQARSLPRPPVKAEQENGLPPTALALAALLFGALFTGVAMHYRERLIPKRFRTPQRDEPGPPHRATVGQKAQPQPPEPMPQGHAPAPHPDEDDARNIAGLSTSAISVAFSGSILDETNLYLSSGHTNKAITLLEEHLNESEDDIHVWIKLFELYAEQGAQDRFAALMPSFQQAFGGDLETQEKIRGIGRALDPDNPLYFAEEEKENLDFDQLAAEAPQMETGLAEIAPAIEEGAAISPPSPPISAVAEETVEPETPAVEPETAHSDDMLPLEIPLEFNIETQKEIKNSSMNLASLPPDDSTAEDASAVNEEAPLELPPLEFSISPPEGAILNGEPLSAPDEEAIALDALPKLLEEPDLPPLGLPKS